MLWRGLMQPLEGTPIAISSHSTCSATIPLGGVAGRPTSSGQNRAKASVSGL